MQLYHTDNNKFIWQVHISPDKLTKRYDKLTSVYDKLKKYLIRKKTLYYIMSAYQIIMSTGLKIKSTSRWHFGAHAI